MKETQTIGHQYIKSSGAVKVVVTNVFTNSYHSHFDELC